MSFSINEAEEKILPWYKKGLGMLGIANLSEKDSMVFGIALAATLFFFLGLFRMLLVLLIASGVTLLITGRMNSLFKAIFRSRRDTESESSN